ncbi:MAG: prefoldin subunit beta [Thermoplasmata archaeon]|nr:MAG: prefoldin subunit beta [Thermoplasmata archaeon]
MAEELSPQLQNKIAQFQQLQQQIQVVSSQKFQLEAQLRDTERAITELENSPKDITIYKNVGNLLVEARDKDKVNKELDEKKETIDIRIKALDRQEKQLVEKYQSLQQELSSAITARKHGQGGS